MREAGESFTELAAAEEMAGIAGSVAEGKLIESERFDDQDAAGTQSALDGGKERALEITKAEDHVEGSAGERESFQVGAQKQKLCATGRESPRDVRG